MIGSAVVFSRLLMSVGLAVVAFLGLFLMGMGLLVLVLIDHRFLHMIGILIMASGASLVFPSSPTLMSGFASGKRFGTILSWNALVADAARVAAPIVYGFLFEEDVKLPFYIGACVAGFGMFAVLAILKENGRLIPTKSLKEYNDDITGWLKPFIPIREEIEAMEITPADKEGAEELGRFMGKLLSTRNYQWQLYTKAVKTHLIAAFPTMPVRTGDAENIRTRVEQIHHQVNAITHAHSLH
jgi:MFS family permease